MAKKRRSGAKDQVSEEFLTWARHAVRGLRESEVMVGIWDSRGSDSLQAYEFALQIGHCLMAQKPLLLLVPVGTIVPPKLEAAATAVEYFDAALGEAATAGAVKRLLKRVGVEQEH